MQRRSVKVAATEVLLLSLLALALCVINPCLCQTQKSVLTNKGSLNYNSVIGQYNFTTNTFGGANGGVNSFASPWGISFNSKGGLYVSDPGNHRVLYYGNLSTSNPTPTGVFGASRFNTTGENNPTGIAVFSKLAGNDIYLAVVDQGNEVLKYEQITPTGEPTLDDVVGLGFISSSAVGVAIDQNSGVLYVTDTDAHRVLVFAADADGSYLPFAAYGGNTAATSSCSTVSSTCFYKPTAVAIDCNSNVWIAGQPTPSNPSYIYIYPQGIYNSSRYIFTGPLPLTGNDFNHITSIAFSATCDYVSIAAVSRVYIFPLSYLSKADPLLGIGTTLGSFNYTTPGLNAPPNHTTDSLSQSFGTAWSPNNTAGPLVYFSDSPNNRVVSILLNTSTSTSTTPSTTTPSPSTTTTPTTTPSTSTPSNSFILVSSSTNTPSASFSSVSAISVTASTSTTPTTSTTSTTSTSTSFSPSSSTSISSVASVTSSPSSAASSNLIGVPSSVSSSASPLSPTQSISTTVTVSMSLTPTPLPTTTSPSALGSLSVASFTSNPINSSSSDDSNQSSSTSTFTTSYTFSPSPSFSGTSSGSRLNCWLGFILCVRMN